MSAADRERWAAEERTAVAYGEQALDDFRSTTAEALNETWNDEPRVWHLQDLLDRATGHLARYDRHRSEALVAHLRIELDTKED